MGIKRSREDGRMVKRNWVGYGAPAPTLTVWVFNERFHTGVLACKKMRGDKNNSIVQVGERVASCGGPG